MIAHNVVRKSAAAGVPMVVDSPFGPTWDPTATPQKSWSGSGFLGKTITLVELVKVVGGTIVVVPTWSVVSDVEFSITAPAGFDTATHAGLWNLRVTSVEDGAVTSLNAVRVSGV